MNLKTILTNPPCLCRGKRLYPVSHFWTNFLWPAPVPTVPPALSPPPLGHIRRHSETPSPLRSVNSGLLKTACRQFLPPEAKPDSEEEGDDDDGDEDETEEGEQAAAQPP